MKVSKVCKKAAGNVPPTSNKKSTAKSNVRIPSVLGVLKFRYDYNDVNGLPYRWQLCLRLSRPFAKKVWAVVEVFGDKEDSHSTFLPPARSFLSTPRCFYSEQKKERQEVHSRRNLQRLPKPTEPRQHHKRGGGETSVL
jgi:hypothetical protein